MTDRLSKFLGLFSQDFDLLYEKRTDPIDQFCGQYPLAVQEAVLAELKQLCGQVFEGKKSLQDIIYMGLEYVPCDDEDPTIWLPTMIDYMEAKIQSRRAASAKTANT